MQKLIVLFLCFLFSYEINAQLIEVQADYTAVGDVQFSAYNNTKAPLFVYMILGELQNTYYSGPLRILEKVTPGYNVFFTLERKLGTQGGVRFHREIKVFRSNPRAIVDLDFPYLIPLEEGKKAEVYDVESIAGFWGDKEPESWNVTGFKVQRGDKVFAARTGTVAEIVGQTRGGKPSMWYHTWTNSVTVLQPDGTLIVYRNVNVKNKDIEVGERIVAGQYIGDAVADNLILLIFQHSMDDEDPRFIIPQFVTAEDKQELLISAKTYDVVHPDEIVQMEMTRKEIRKYKRRK